MKAMVLRFLEVFLCSKFITVSFRIFGKNEKSTFLTSKFHNFCIYVEFEKNVILYTP